jgi:hypothetical protein
VCTIGPELIAERVIPILAIVSGLAESTQAKPLVTRRKATRNTAEMRPVMRDRLCIMLTIQ